MKVIVNITTEDGELLEQLSVTKDTETDGMFLANEIVEVIEFRFETGEE